MAAQARPGADRGAVHRARGDVQQRERPGVPGPLPAGPAAGAGGGLVPRTACRDPQWYVTCVALDSGGRWTRGSERHEPARTDPEHQRPRPRRRPRRRRPAVRLELHLDPGRLRAVVGAVGGVPRHPFLPAALAADARRGRVSGEAVPQPRAVRLLALLAGIVWTLPNTLPGLVAGLAGLAFGARVGVGPEAPALVFRRFPWGPGGALTLGNVILHTGESLQTGCRTYAHRAGLCEEPEIVLGDHERAHVYQY